MKYENETFKSEKYDTRNCGYIQNFDSLKYSGRDQRIINYRNIKYICKELHKWSYSITLELKTHKIVNLGVRNVTNMIYFYWHTGIL